MGTWGAVQISGTVVAGGSPAVTSFTLNANPTSHQSSGGSRSDTIGPLTVPANTRLVVAVNADSNSTGPRYFQVTNNGAALTWTKLGHAGVSSSSQTEMHTAYVTTSRTVTLTVTEVNSSGGAPTADGLLWDSGCWMVSNAQADPFGGTVLVDDTGGMPSGSLTVGNNDIILMSVADWSATAGTQTYVPAGATTDHDVGAGGNSARSTMVHFGTQTAGTLTVGETAPTGQNARMVAVDIKPFGTVVVLVAPDAPTGVSGSAGNQQVTVSFTTPVNNGGASIDNYRVTPYISGVAQTTTTGSSSPITVTGLTNSTAYTFTVAAHNSVGWSAESTASAPVTPSTQTGPSPAYYTQRSKGLPSTDTFFPIGVFEQDPTWAVVTGDANNAAALGNAGVNLIVNSINMTPSNASSYMSKWASAGIWLIGDAKDPPNGIDSTLPNWAVANPSQATHVVGWHIADEPDMKLVSGDRTPYSPAHVQSWHDQVHAIDPDRIIHANFGKPFGLYPWNGYQTISGSNETADLTAYAAATELMSSDYYAWTDPYEDSGSMTGSKHGAWKYGIAVDSMRKFAATTMPVYGFVETGNPWTSTDDSSGSHTITAAQVEQAVWQCIIHGARGVIYFIHQMNTAAAGGVNYNSLTGLSNYATTRATVTALNARIAGLAQVLNSSQIGTVNTNGREIFSTYVAASSSNSIPVDVMVRQFGGHTYIFAQASGTTSSPMGGACTGTFTLAGALAGYSGSVTVRDESRTITASGGVFTDTFTTYQTHIYVI